jgi:predicted RNA-binding protein with PUA-like domain|tara:strand:- start:63614 stop:64021 length:408 start_codon:yes stop_codon:yes gene_type:complete
MNHWLIKSEPNTYSWDDFVKLGRDHWDGVRNYQARNNLKTMLAGDLALFYHSVNEKAVVGLAEVVREFYPDPTSTNDAWVVVDLVPIQKLKNSVTLAMIKEDDRLSEMVLVKNSRLSVQPVSQEAFDIIIGMSEI